MALLAGVLEFQVRARDLAGHQQFFETRRARRACNPESQQHDRDDLDQAHRVPSHAPTSTRARAQYASALECPLACPTLCCANPRITFRRRKAANGNHRRLLPCLNQSDLPVRRSVAPCGLAAYLCRRAPTMRPIVFSPRYGKRDFVVGFERHRWESISIQRAQITFSLCVSLYADTECIAAGGRFA